MTTPMTLGQLKKALQRQPLTAQCVFDFCHSPVIGCGSWRGSYAEPSLNPGGKGDDRTTVAEVLEFIESLLTESHTGYKGGEYRYTADQEVRVDPYGHCSDTVVIGVWEQSGLVILQTGDSPW